MIEYHKINTVFKRDGNGKIIHGEWSQPEFQYLANLEWQFTEKVDGTNIRIRFSDGNVSFAGRTERAQIPPKLLDFLNKTFKPLANHFKTGEVVHLYGEGYGAGIQKVGHHYRQDQEFILFDVKIGKWWLRRQDVDEIACDLGIPSVPVIGVGSLYKAIDLCKNGFQSRFGDFEAEGIVARPVVELLDHGGNRVITKIKCRDFNFRAEDV